MCLTLGLAFMLLSLTVAQITGIELGGYPGCAHRSISLDSPLCRTADPDVTLQPGESVSVVIAFTPDCMSAKVEDGTNDSGACAINIVKYCAFTQG